MSRIYADYAAGAPLHPAAAAALHGALAADVGNASSAHWAGTRARALLEGAREDVAAAIGAHPLEVVFTSGATEANNLAIAGSAAARPGIGFHVAVPATEHSSVLEPARALVARGHRVTILRVAADGSIARDDVAAAAPDLLSVAVVNAETGLVQPCRALAAAVREHGGRVHVDAAQAAGRVAVHVDELGADLLTLSGHKIGGPQGTGALYVRRGNALDPLLRGGPQENGRRAGTENVAAIAGFAAALSAAVAARERESARLAALVERLRRGLAALDPDVRIAGERHDEAGAGSRAPHVLNVTFSDLNGESLVAALDLEGIAVAAGSACAAGAAEPSHVLLAMGWSRAEAASALRFSFGWASTDADVDRILAVLPGIVVRGRRQRQETAWPAHAS